MTEMNICELASQEVFVRGIEVFPESWEKRKRFELYKETARPFSALFFVCTDITATFCPEAGVPVTAGKGDVIYIPQGVRYHTYIESDTVALTDTYTINFSLSSEADPNLILSSRILKLASRQDTLFQNSLSRLCAAAHGSRRNNLLINSEFFKLLDLIYTSTDSNYGSYYPIRSGVEALKKQWNRNIKMDNYARLCGVSTTYFYRCFREFSGKSPIEYRNELRLSSAETMLRLTDMPISEISSVTGFSDQFYFCRLFTKHYGVSPQKYRKTVHN